MRETREKQLAYSDAQELMLDEPSRRAKARKMAAIIQHFLGTADLTGLRIADVGCSGGIVADELRRRGALVTGLDIDRPGLSKAQQSYGRDISFVAADSQALPVASDSFDVVICNHVYEHVVSPERLFAELRRVVRPSGLLYLGLGNRLGIIEPHYRLPFLSWLPRRLAHRYVRALGRADHYHEAFTTRRGLRRLCSGLVVWDYTLSVLGQPEAFNAGEDVPGWLSRLPKLLVRSARPLVPTYLWIATTAPSSPAGPQLHPHPARVATS